MKKGAIFGFIMIGLLSVVGVIYYGQLYAEVSSTSFPESGYVLISNALDSESKKVEFSAGATYQSNVDGNIRFLDIQENTAEVEQSSFLHYNDASLAALDQGLIVKLDEVSNAAFVNHYSIGAQVVLYSANNGYQVDNQGVALDFEQFIWKTSEDTYMIVSQELAVNFGVEDVRMVDGFVEITYVDSGVVQIQTQDNLWQTISPACTVSLGNGLELHLADRYITDDTDTPVFYLSNMVIHADDNVAIHNLGQVESAELSVPKFDITTENGVDGVQGEEGTSGDQGEQGEQGTQGDQGEQGIQGDQGEDGSAGSAGETGADGTDGDDGNDGDNGDKGSSGAVGGTGGTTGDDGTTEETMAQPTFSLTDWSVTSTSVTFTLLATDEDYALIDQDSEIYLVDMSTGQIIYTTYNNFSTTLEYSATLPADGSLLTPDHQYRLVVYGYYEDIDANVYGMEFFSKSFYTDSSGVFMDAAYATESQLWVDLTRADYSMAISATVYLFDNFDAANEFDATSTTVTYRASASYPFTSVGEEDYALLKFVADGSDISSGADEVITLFSEITPDTDEVITLFSEITPDTNYYFRAVYTTTEGSTLTPAVLQMKTLKELATVEAPTVITNRGTYTFDVYPAVSDPYNGVESITYYVYAETDYNDQGTDAEAVLTVKSTTTDMVSIPIGTSVQADTSYVVVAELTFYDNEKTVYITSEASSPVYMTGVQMPPVTFVFAEGCGTNYTSSTHESIYGSILINANSSENASTTSATIDVSYEHPLYLTVSAPGVHQQTFTFTETVEPGSATGNVAAVSEANGVITIENICLTSLQEDTQYTFTISGYVDFHDETYDNYVQTVIGNCVITTGYAASVRASFTQNELTQNSFEVTLLLADAEDSSAATATTMATAQRMEVSIYSGREAEPANMLYTVVIEDEDEALNSSDIKADFYDEGAKGYTFTEDDFPVNISSGQYAIAVSAIYDYTYETVSTSTEGIYLSTYANEIPVVDDGNLVVVNITDKLPAEPAYGTMTAMAITNDVAADYGGVRDINLADDAIVGYVLYSGYDNSAAFGVNITYYAFENAAFQGFTWDKELTDYADNAIYQDLDSKQVYDVYDPIICDEQLFKTEAMSFVSGSAPGVILLFGDNPSGTTDANGDGIDDGFLTATGYTAYYTGAYDDTTGTGVSRGMQLTFSYVVGYNNYFGSTVLGYYPYDLYVSATQKLPNTSSSVQDAPYARPILYAYPWASDNSNVSANYISSAVWKYWLCDTDGTLTVNTSYGLTTSGENKVNLLLDGATYRLDSDRTLPGGLGMTALGFAEANYKDNLTENIGSDVNVYLEVSDTATVGTMKNTVITLPSASDVPVQMSAKATLYNTDIYPLDEIGTAFAGIDLSAVSAANKDTSGAVMSELPLFAVDNSNNDTIWDTDVNNLTNPTFTSNAVDGTYTISFTDTFPSYNTGEVDDVLSLVAGVKLEFTGTTDGNANKTVTLYKTLSTSGAITGSLTELSDVALTNPTMEVTYLYPGENRGYYNVGQNNYALQGYYDNGQPAAYYAYSSLSGTDFVTSNYSTTTPAMSSFFYSSSAATLGSSANYTLYSRETGLSISAWSGDSHDYMYTTYGNAATINAPISLEESWGSQTVTDLVVPFAVPEMDLQDAGIEKTIDSITFTSFDIYGATVENVGAYMYFTIQEQNGDFVYYNEAENKYWPVDLSDYTDLAATWDDLEMDTVYIISAYTKSDGGSSTTYDLLSKYNATGSAVYYVSTSSEVEATVKDGGYVVSSYSSKYYYAYFSLSEIQDLYLEYEIFNADGTPVATYTDNGDGTYTYTPVYYKSDKADVISGALYYSKTENLVSFQFGHEDFAMLSAGDYYLEIRVLTTNSDEIVGTSEFTFTVPTVSDPYIGMSSLPSYDSDDTLTTPYGLEISVAVLDQGRITTAAAETSKGDYVLMVYEVNTGDIVYVSGVNDTGSPATYYITELKEDTSYQAVYISLKDDNSDGCYTNADGQLETLPTLAAFMATMADYTAVDKTNGTYTYKNWSAYITGTNPEGEAYIPYSGSVYIVQYADLFTTMVGNGVYYEGVSVVNSGSDVYVQFTGAIGIEGAVASIQGTIYYYTATGELSTHTVDLTDPAVEDMGSGRYRIDTGFDIQKDGKHTFQSFVVYLDGGVDDDGEQLYTAINTLSGTYYFYS